MYRTSIPLSKLSLGQNPLVDLYTLRDYLTYWYEEETKSTYGTHKDILRDLALVAQALSRTLEDVAATAAVSEYREAYDELVDSLDVNETQEALREAGDE